MLGAQPGHNIDREDSYGYDEETLKWFERFDLSPVDPEEIDERVASGAVLETLDLPSHLNRQLIVEPETGVALYRLVQLFGTPNVRCWTAGGEMPERGATTWLYLFEVVYRPADGADRTFLLSVYDDRTNVSAGLSCWSEGASGSDADAAPVGTPGETVPEGVEPPDEEFCEGLVQLVLNLLEEPVPATYKELWV